MARSFVFASGKGGVGKSTAAAAIGTALSKSRKVLLVDCDAGLNALSLLLGANESLFSWEDVLRERCAAKEALVKINDSLFLLPAPQTLPHSAESNAITSVVKAVETDFDYILYDAPAGFGPGLAQAAGDAEAAIIVATADPVSVRGAEKTAELLLSGGVKDARLLLNRYQIKAAKKGKLLSIDEVMDRTYLRLLGVVPEDKNVTYNAVTGQRRDNTPSALAFRRIADRLEGKNVLFRLSFIK